MLVTKWWDTRLISVNTEHFCHCRLNSLWEEEPDLVTWTFWNWRTNISWKRISYVNRRIAPLLNEIKKAPSAGENTGYFRFYFNQYVCMATSYILKYISSVREESRLCHKCWTDKLGIEYMSKNFNNICEIPKGLAKDW